MKKFRVFWSLYCILMKLVFLKWVLPWLGIREKLIKITMTKIRVMMKVQVSLLDFLRDLRHLQCVGLILIQYWLKMWIISSEKQKEGRAVFNCGSLVTVKLNQLVWDIVSPVVRSRDKKMQTIETTVINAACILAKIVDRAAIMEKWG